MCDLFITHRMSFKKAKCFFLMVSSFKYPRASSGRCPLTLPGIILGDLDPLLETWVTLFPLSDFKTPNHYDKFVTFMNRLQPTFLKSVTNYPSTLTSRHEIGIQRSGLIAYSPGDTTEGAGHKILSLG